MPVTTEPSASTPIGVVEDIQPAVLLTGIGLSSFATLLLELSLTRLFSVILFYHFAFLAISIALLGLGAGGVFAHLGRNYLSRHELQKLISSLCISNAVVIPIVLEIALHLPVSLEMTWGNVLRLTTIYLSSTVPFFLTGLEFSIIFAGRQSLISRLYGADLFGGAIACLAIVPLLNAIGGPNTILFAALAAASTGLIWSKGALRRTSIVVILLLLCSLGINYSGRLIDIVYAKGKLRDRSMVEFARWNAISRVEVDRVNDAKAIVIDADANSYIMNADPARWRGSLWQKNLMAAPPALANVLRPHGDYAIIGPGGGVDVLRAVGSGSPSVTGIEINPLIANTIMRGQYADYAYHLYERPEVHLHVTDGRSFIRNASQQFDVVQMTLVDTWASTAAGAFALSENNLYTVEAFQEYFHHLKPDGMIAITRWEFQSPREALRVVSVAMEALRRMGVQQVSRNFIVVSDGNLDADGIPVVVLAKKSAFTSEEESAVNGHLTQNRNLAALYMPSRPRKNAFTSLIFSNDPYTFAKTYPYNVAPVTDNAPFFFFTMRLGDILRARSLQQGLDWKVNLGVAVLLIVFVISVLAVLAFLVIPLAFRRSGGSDAPVVPLLYFIALGMGYIMVEITFIQRFVLFLGHPTYALTVVVFLLLLSSGVGSLVSRKWLRDTRHLRLPLISIVVLLALYVCFLPRLLNTLVGLLFVGKLIVSAVVLAPLGFIMGMPFPTGLRALSIAGAMQNWRAPSTLIEWTWAMNAGASVLGSVSAILIAIRFGLNITLVCASAAYCMALFAAHSLSRSATQWEADYRSAMI